MGRVSQFDVARSLGLTQQAVSYALSGRKAVSESTRRQVLSAAARLGYRPNIAARTMRSGHFGTVAVLVGTRWPVSHLPMPLLSGIEAALERQGLRMLVTRVGDEKLTDPAYVPRILRELAADGLLVTYNECVPGRMMELVRQFRLPSIWVNARLPRDCVYPDDLSSARRATEHLLAMGHRRIAYSHHAWSSADAAEGHYSVADRKAGCAAAMRQAGLTLLPGPVRRKGEGDDLDANLAAALRRLSSSDRPTAAVCYCVADALALAIAAYRLGLSVPRDLSMIAFADSPDGFVLDKRLTTMVIPHEKVGTEAVNVLQARLDGRAHARRGIAIEATLAPGATCGPPPRKGKGIY